MTNFLRSLRTHDLHNTDQRQKVLETVTWCHMMREGCEYTGPYRPDARLVQIGDDALHNLMGFRSEHSDPLAF